MGEYEPDDSRNITRTDTRAPGEPPRTGPREDAVRREAAHDAGTGRQAQFQRQAQSGQSQTQSWLSDAREAAAWDNDAAQTGGARAGDFAEDTAEDTKGQDEEVQPLAGGYGRAADEPAPAFDPHFFDPATAGGPQNMRQPDAAEEDVVRRQASMQGGEGGFGYGADGDAEMADAPDASERGPEHAQDHALDEAAAAAALRRRREAGEPEVDAYFKR